MGLGLKGLGGSWDWGRGIRGLGVQVLGLSGSLQTWVQALQGLWIMELQLGLTISLCSVHEPRSHVGAWGCHGPYNTLNTLHPRSIGPQQQTRTGSIPGSGVDR